MNLKKILKVAGVLAVIGGSIVLYQLYKPHRDAVGEKASMEMLASDLLNDYLQDEEAANNTYKEVVIKVKGEVSEADAEHIKFKAGVTISGDFSNSNAKVGDQITVKGRITAYDELYEEVSLDNGSLDVD